ncbi:hypothetical protein GCM10027432_09390 [Lysobacter fragariae]
MSVPASQSVIEERTGNEDGTETSSLASSSSHAKPGGAAEQKYLLAESSYFSNDQLNIPAIQRTMTGSGFEKQLELLEKQMLVDPNASDLTRTYAAELQKQLQNAGMHHGSPRLACGLSLCMGLVTGGRDDSSYQAWWADFEKSPKTPHTIGIDYTQQMVNDTYQHRFVFVTDPDVRGFSNRLR